VTDTRNRFFIDAPSILLGNDGVVRYTMVVQNTTGARTVTFEGIRCSAASQRYYALGQSDGTWSPARSGDWRQFDTEDRTRPQAVLFFDVFCPGRRIPVHTIKEAIERLKSGPPRIENYE
jgi:hypothetical protein